jgi:hypothetical protein
VSGLAISATDVDAPGAATVTQRKPSPIRASSRFQLIKERPPGRVGQCPEHEIHATHIGNHLVSCQDGSASGT